MPLPQWEDRRALFSKGREVHEPSVPSARRASESSITETLTKAVSNTSTKAAEPASPTAAKMPFEKRASVSSGSPASPTAGTSTAANRRRSSAASGSGGMFANLTGMKRGSEDYHDRRSSIEEMHGKSGMFHGLWGSTVRGVQKKPETINETKRGVME